MKLITRILINALAVFILANTLTGIIVKDYIAAIIVAITLGILNTIIRPILVLLTLPITIITFGLFLFIINACIIMLADAIVPGFYVTSFWYALLFSILLSILQSILFSLLKKD